VAQTRAPDYPARVSSPGSGGLALGALRLLPLHALSHAAGRVAGWRVPRFLRRPAYGLFARAVGADLSETRDPLDSFERLQDFFTRALVPGARPVDPAPDAVVAPCDGAWGASGRVEAGMLLQVKGRPYPLAALLGDPERAGALEGGAFATFYLAPRDYHRFHAPCDAEIVGAVHLPGALWPVNRIGVEGVPGLFAENERIVASMRVPGASGDVSLCIAAVGATLVGRVRLAFDTLQTHTDARAPVRRDYPEPHRLARGEEWGRFEFGSTLVLVAAPDVLELDAEPPGTRLRLGTRVGRLTRPTRPAPPPASG